MRARVIFRNIGYGIRGEKNEQNKEREQEQEIQEKRRQEMTEQRTWRQVGRVLEQMIDRYDEELVDLEIKLSRLEDEGNLSAKTIERLKARYTTRMVEVLEKYHAMWIAQELMYSLFHDPDALERQGLVVPSNEEDEDD